MTSHRIGIRGALLAVAAASLFAGCELQQAPPRPDDVTVTQSDGAALTGPSCTPTGAHVAHSAYACTTCHSVPGSLCFDPAGPAQAPGKPAPAFDFTAKTCSNVACHGMYEGVFEYTVWDWGCECLVTQSVPYGGSGGATPSWYTTGPGGCAACHGNPPTIPGTSSRYTWHYNTHGQPNPSANQCGTCHPAGLGNNVTGGTGINPAFAAQHGNGVLDVSPKWTSSCYSCH
jgi:hypothetical protein